MAAPVPTSFTDMGKTDVLMIVSEFNSQNPQVVQRRGYSQLSADEQSMLESQGVTRAQQTDDLAIMKARYALDQDCCVLDVEQGDELTALKVKEIISSLMANSESSSIIIHYMGPGKQATGDWCFSDGFISFRDLMSLYVANKRPRGRPVLFLCSDCAYSGSWIKEAMNFLDERDIGPCGHVAKDRDLQLTVQGSCLDSEIPRELAYTTHSMKNDKNTGCVLFRDFYRNKAIVDGQHPTKINFYSLQCKNEMEQPCTMAPGSTWKTWRTGERLCIITNPDNVQPKWNIVLFKDDERVICEFLMDRNGESIVEHVHILKSGWGAEPPSDIKEWMKLNYRVNYDLAC